MKLVIVLLVLAILIILMAELTLADYYSCAKACIAATDDSTEQYLCLKGCRIAYFG